MKRCKACTTRAAGAIECTLEAEHEGAHEGRRRTLLSMAEARIERVLWNDPNAPYFEPLEEPEPAPLEMFDHVAADVAIGSPESFCMWMEQASPAPYFSPARATATHCACGVEHSAADPELRGFGGAPLTAQHQGELDQRFSWPRVCLHCGTVYCLIWHPEVPR